MRPIVPALIPTDLDKLRSDLDRLTFSSEVHIDVTDGKFVPYTSWPYMTGVQPKIIKESTDRFTLEVDLMVEDPISAAKAWLEAGADMLVFHVETLALGSFMDFATSNKISIGISALNSTDYKTLESYILVADYVQVMGIAEIGAQGQPFDSRAISRIEEIKKNFPDITISLDGSVNDKTLPDLKSQKIDRFICGSAIVGQADYFTAYQNLKKLIN